MILCGSLLGSFLPLIFSVSRTFVFCSLTDCVPQSLLIENSFMQAQTSLRDPRVLIIDVGRFSGGWLQQLRKIFISCYRCLAATGSNQHQRQEAVMILSLLSNHNLCRADAPCVYTQSQFKKIKLKLNYYFNKINV